jgi:hypothetical protein
MGRRKWFEPDWSIAGGIEVMFWIWVGLTAVACLAVGCAIGWLIGRGGG